MYIVRRRRTALHRRPGSLPQRRRRFRDDRHHPYHTPQRPSRSAVAGIVVAQPRCVASDAEAAARPSRASPELEALIKAHRAAYRHFVDRAIPRDVSKPVYQSLSRAEEGALLAICAYPAVTHADRRCKVHYLMAVEKRGELDLPEHMEAVLRSML